MFIALLEGVTKRRTKSVEALKERPETYLDVLVVGAGLSGVTAAYRLKTECPEKTFLVVEARERMGGTWDLFRYPGVRSDSDMYTFGFPFEPWHGEKSIADGPDIRAYIKSTARKHAIEKYIRYRHRVLSARWSSSDRQWEVAVQTDADTVLYTCRFLWICSGYFSYEGGYTPSLPGLENFPGTVVHPQEWPQNLDYRNQRIVIVGSGATAVTLLPALAREAAHVTLLQRSPGYVSEIPRVDPWVVRLNAFLPHKLASWILRWKGILYQSFVFRLARKFPGRVARLLKEPLSTYFSPKEIERHFTPNYGPWEQRLCVDTDGEYLKALASDRASIVTDQILGFSECGIHLASGRTLQADILVTATGLVVELFGRIQIEVDGAKIEPSNHLIYKGAMLNDVPNMLFSLGYTNMSWTLKCDLTARYACRLIRHLDSRNARVFRPRIEDPEIRPVSLIDFSSGYLQRATAILPKQGSKSPWKLHQSYLADLVQTELAPVDDGTLEFS